MVHWYLNYKHICIIMTRNNVVADCVTENCVKRDLQSIKLIDK